MIFHNYGIFWDLRLVDFGRQGRGGSGSLKGYVYESQQNEASDESKQKKIRKKHSIVDFSQQSGVYALQKSDRNIVYIGQTGRKGDSLLARLREHSRSNFKGRWTHFSWFGFRPANGDKILDEQNLESKLTESIALDHIEGILLELIEPNLNKRGANWKNVQRYSQYDVADFESDKYEPIGDDSYAIWKKLGELEKKLLKPGDK
ncbi:MAG: hypothetical protein ACRDBL_05515 [Rhabdaerophilum sp.]